MTLPGASIVLLTFNGEEYLEELLDAIAEQKTTFAFETIVIDSGSTDRTLEIVRRHAVRLHQIPNSEFNHGGTRNLGATMAQSDYVAYVTQSATPADTSWLQHLVDAFGLDGDDAFAFGDEHGGDVGEVELAVGVVGVEGVEFLKESLGLEAVDSGVDFRCVELLGGEGFLFDDSSDFGALGC